MNPVTNTGLNATSNVLELECSACGKKYDADVEQHLCTCGKPLLARYDLKRAAETFTLATLKDRPRNLWRYAEVLPDDPPVSLGEGMTPLVHAKRLGASVGLANLYVKDEGLNPTGSFKARGMSAAVTRAKQLGVKALAAPTAGNAGGALAAYAAAAGLPAVIVMPADTPSANVMECQAFGAQVVKLNGLISDCGKYVAERKDRERWYDVSTLKEPYRVEGKKTMGYELWEQHRESAEFFQNAATIASGLRVPGPLGDLLILKMLKQTKGTALTVTDTEMLEAGRELARLEGIFAAPEGAATAIAARKLAASGWIRPSDTVVLFNTGTGYKYSEAWQRALQA